MPSKLVGVKVQGAAPGANTAIFGGIAPTTAFATFRVTVALATASVLNMTETPSGGTKKTYGLNGSVPLAANDEYEFNIQVVKFSTLGGTTAMSYDFEVETDSVLNKLIVEELTGV